MARLPALAHGFDTMVAPGAGATADRVLAHFWWLAQHTNWHVAGGYPTIALRSWPASGAGKPLRGEWHETGRAWSPVITGIRRQGWGTALFVLATGGLEFKWFFATTNKVAAPDPATWPLVHQDPPPGATTPAARADLGTQHGRRIKELLQAAHADLPAVTVWLDNEDNLSSHGVNGLNNPPPSRPPEFVEDPDMKKAGHPLVYSIANPNLAERPWEAPFTGPLARVRKLTDGMTEMLPYYRALLSELALRGTDGDPALPTVRVGLYVHLHLARELAGQFPDLFLCDVEYGTTRVGRGTLPPECAPQGPARWTFHSGLPNLLPAADHGGALLLSANARHWGHLRMWPVLFQWEGDNVAPLPSPTPVSVAYRSATYKVAFNGQKDFDSSLVGDPAYPAASPRLALDGSGSWLATLRSAGWPARDTDEADARLDLLDVTSGGWTRIAAPAGRVFVQGVQPLWTTAPDGGAVLTAYVRQIGGDAVSLPAWTVAAAKKPGDPPVIASVRADLLGSPRPGEGHAHLPSLVCARSAKDLHVFTAVPNGTILTTRGDPADHAPRTERIHATTSSSRRVHPYSRFAGCAQARTGRPAQFVALLFVAADGTLVATDWADWEPWPGTDWKGIGRAATMLASGGLAAASPNPDALVVAAVGSDLRLQVASWYGPGKRWSGPTGFGPQSAILNPTTAVALAVPCARSSEAVAVAIDNNLQLVEYRLHSTGRGEFSAADPVVIAAPTPPPAGWRDDTPVTRAPHPLSDLALSSSSDRMVLASVWITGETTVVALGTRQCAAKDWAWRDVRDP